MAPFGSCLGLLLIVLQGSIFVVKLANQLSHPILTSSGYPRIKVVRSLDISLIINCILSGYMQNKSHYRPVTLEGY